MSFKKHTKREQWSVFRVPLPSRKQAALHIHDFHEWFFCTEGNGEQLVSEKSFPMASGDLFFFPSGCGHVARSIGSKVCRGIVVYQPPGMFGGGDAGEQESQRLLTILIEQARRGDYTVPLTKHGKARIGEILAQMLQEEKSRSPGFRMARHAYMQMLLLEILRYITDTGLREHFTAGSEGPERLTGVLQFIDTNYDQPLSVSQVAEVAGLSRSHFHAIFKACTGQTFIEYLNRKRVEKAIRILSEGGVTLARAGARAGFSSTSHMYNVFRQYKGHPPGYYRKSTVH
ncbi:MAG: AraC family transcriptional regulator [Lentisphaeria bacterium]